jgi:biopolymer transport protein ExbD
MAGGARFDDEDVIAGINVTPLVDITLVLLIIFMVTAKIIVSHTINVDLPKAASAGDQQIFFAISIDKEGHVLADKVPMDSDEKLKAAALAALGKNKDMRTVIQASTAVNYGVVIHVMDVLHLVGITRIGFAVDKTAGIGAKPAASTK